MSFERNIIPNIDPSWLPEGDWYDDVIDALRRDGYDDDQIHEMLIKEGIIDGEHD